MKKTISFLIVLIIIFSVSLNCFAVLSDNLKLRHQNVIVRENANNLVGKFDYNNFSSEVKEFYTEFIENFLSGGKTNPDFKYLVTLVGNDNVYFYRAPTTSNFQIEKSSSKIKFYSSFKFVCFKYDSSSKLLKATTTVSNSSYCDLFVGNGTLVHNSYSCNLSLGQTYEEQFVSGVNGFKDNNDETPTPTPTPPPKPDEEGTGSFLKDFWKNILDFFKKIFIPEDDFFTKWYQDIKNVVDKKFAAIFGIFDILKKSFESIGNLSSNGLILNIPAGHFFNSFGGTSVDLLKFVVPFLNHIKSWLTMFVVFITAIVCYKRIVVLFEQ